MRCLTMLRFILLYVYVTATGRFLTTAQSIDEYYYRSDIIYNSFDNTSDGFSASESTSRVSDDESVDEYLVESLEKEDPNVYCLHTRENPLTEEILVYKDINSINASKFNSSKVTVFLIHGWVGNRKSMINTLLTEAFLQDNDVNVIVVDWGAVAKENYFTAVLSIRGVGKHIGKFIKWLTTLGMSYENVHIVGHSLGAHVAGVAGSNTEARIKRITGLDPAGPLWTVLPYRLTKNNAQYVEAIHTNTKCLGYNGLCGHADFFPNGGERMPGCVISACSHAKSYQYMAETVIHNNMYATQCSNMKEVLADSCNGELYPMGNSDLTKNRTGIFRVTTDRVYDLPPPLITRRFMHSDSSMECELFHDIWRF